METWDGFRYRRRSLCEKTTPALVLTHRLSKLSEAPSQDIRQADMLASPSLCPKLYCPV